MLMLNSTKRLSIDIDIIISEKDESLQGILSKIADNKGFAGFEEQKRKTISGIEKAHYKFFYPNALKADDEDFILLDILFEKIHYTTLISIPIQSSFVLNAGDNIETRTPDFNNIMGDKLTAFAPNTTGIPYFKNDRPMGQEIIKQLYDIGNIFEEINDVKIVYDVFVRFAIVELQFRDLGSDVNIVLDDIVENCLSIALRQPIGNTNFEVLQLGLKQITNYIFPKSIISKKPLFMLHEQHTLQH